MPENRYFFLNLKNFNKKNCFTILPEKNRKKPPKNCFFFRKSTNHYPRDTSAWNHFHENEEFGATLYYHPIDPVLFLKVGSFWLVAHRQADVSDDFIVSKNLEH